MLVVILPIFVADTKIIFRYDSVAPLMSKTYSKPFQISKMMRHIENPGIKFIQTFLSVFSDIYQYSIMFRNIQRR